MQESYRYSPDLSGVDELLDASSYMDDTSSTFGFESNYLLSEVDDGDIGTYEKLSNYCRQLHQQMSEIESYLKQNNHLNRRVAGHCGIPSHRNPMFRNGASPLLLMPTGGTNSTDRGAGNLNSNKPNTTIPQVEWDGQQRRNTQSSQVQRAASLEDEALRRQWFKNQKPVPIPKVKLPVKSQQLQLECRPPPPPSDDPYEPLQENLLVKVRHIHPTPSLHELHVQHPGVFRQKPIFTSFQFDSTQQRRKRFAVLCQFNFNGATLYAQETARTKSDAKLNAARAMIRKLEHTANVTTTLKDESMRAASDSSLKNPRYWLLHLHDTQPDIYPQPPTFRASRCRTQQNIGKSRYNNMLCYFQVGADKLKTVGSAPKKKQAIAEAARNMLRLLALPEHSDKNNQLLVADRTQTPWYCHFCKIYMTGRRPFMSHLMGRCHVQILSELGLNAEDENKALTEMAENAFKEKEELKEKIAAKNNTRKKNQKPRFPKLGLAGKENIPTATTRMMSQFPATTPSFNRFPAVTPKPGWFPELTCSGFTCCDAHHGQGSEKSDILVSVPCSSSGSLA